MKYSINWSESKDTSTGKKMLKATLKDETGTLIEGVTIWDSFPNFAGLMTGHDVEGDIVEKQNGQYVNLTLYPKKEAISSPRGSQARTSAIAGAMEKKEASINKFQDNKELSIKVSSTMRMAVDTAIAFISSEPIKDVGVFKSQVEQWRAWYWQNWDKSDTDYPPFN